MSRRKVPPKPVFTFSNGVSVTLERIGPLFALPIQQANPPPPPPLAPGVGGQLEPNPADPDYEKTLQEHQQKVNLLIQDAAMDMGVSDDLEIDSGAVARIRRVYAKQGIELPDDDRMVYLKYACLCTQEDIQGLYEAIRNYDVTEEAIAAAADMFSGDSLRPAIVGGVTDATEVQAVVFGTGAR